jgi:hypothetical protein
MEFIATINATSWTLPTLLTLSFVAIIPDGFWTTVNPVSGGTGQKWLCMYSSRSSKRLSTFVLLKLVNRDKLVASGFFSLSFYKLSHLCLPSNMLLIPFSRNLFMFATADLNAG